jgi:endo-1,4-beta-xylanase
MNDRIRHASAFAAICFSAMMLAGTAALADQTGEADSVVRLWPAEPPTWSVPAAAERDTSGPDSRTVAGKPVVRLGNVSNPELHVFPAKDAKTAIVLCPGGGFSILAWDLEGTEIAQWLQQHGVSVAVLKYRVPTRNEDTKWLAPVQDAQRAVALIRSGAVKSIDAAHVGVMGFSAGGHTAVRTVFADKRLYEPVDQTDQAGCGVDFAALIYPAYLTTSRRSEEMIADLDVDENTPPMFFAHAFDDPLTCMGSVGLFAELKRHNVPSSLHIFSGGGHGFGGRDTGEEKDQWLPLLKAWLVDRGF